MRILQYQKESVKSYIYQSRKGLYNENNLIIYKTLDKFSPLKSFIGKIMVIARTLPEDKGNLAIASTIITLGKNLGMSTLAEGVETKEQLNALKNMGCDQVQGYYFSKPLPADELETYYRNFHR